jgi:hypothetical protein
MALPPPSPSSWAAREPSAFVSRPQQRFRKGLPSPWSGGFPASARSLLESRLMAASLVPCVWHGSAAVNVDHEQLVWVPTERSRGLHGTRRARPVRWAGETGGGTNLRTHADLVQHWCRPTSAPIRNRFHRFYKFFLLFFLLYPYGVWHPATLSPMPTRPRLVQRCSDPRAAFAGRRLPSRLDG